MLSDDALLHRYTRHRDADAFRVLVDRHADMVYRTCLRITRSAADAEDASQECFLELARGARSVRRHVGAWLHTVARRRAMRVLDRRRHHPAADGTVAEASTAEAPGDLVGRVDEALDQLPADQRTVLILRFVEGLTQGETAARLGCHQGTISRREQRGMEALRQSLRAGALVVAVRTLAAAGTGPSAPVSLVGAAGKIALAAPLTAASGSVAIAALVAAVLSGAALATTLLGLSGPTGMQPPATVAASAAAEEAAADPWADRLATAIAGIDRMQLQRLANGPLPAQHAVVRHVAIDDPAAYPAIGIGWLLAAVDGQQPALSDLPAGSATVTLIDRDGEPHTLSVHHAAGITITPAWRPALDYLRSERRNAAWDDLALVTCEWVHRDPALSAEAQRRAEAAGWQDGVLKDSLSAARLLMADRPAAAAELLMPHADADDPAVAALLRRAAIAIGDPQGATPDLRPAIADLPRGCALPADGHWSAEVIHGTGNLKLWGGRNGSLSVLRELGEGVITVRGFLDRNSPSYYRRPPALHLRIFRGDPGTIPDDWDDWAPWIAELEEDRLVIHLTVSADGHCRLRAPALAVETWQPAHDGEQPIDIDIIHHDDHWQIHQAGARVARFDDAADSLSALITTSPYTHFIGRGVSVDHFGPDRRSPLLQAIMADDAAGVQAAVAAGADPDTSSTYILPLAAAVAGGHLAAIDALLAAGADSDAQSGWNQHAALGEALEFRRPAAWHVLIAHGIDPQAEAAATPLVAGEWDPWPEQLLENHDNGLLESGLSAGVRLQGDWLKPLMNEQPPLHALDQLEAHGIDLGWYGLIARDDSIGLSAMVAATPDLLDQRINGATPLHVAINLRRHAIARQLIAAGADVDAVTPANRNAPLHWAIARTADLEAVRLLLEAGADPRIRVRWNEDAVEMAQRYGFAAALPLLRQRAALLEAAETPADDGEMIGF